jgi:uncharacterized membrane protein (DUF2068 family)
MESQNDLLAIADLTNKRRRDLLPWWIKIFIWIFLVFGAIIPVAIIFGVIQYKFQISLYGIETNNPLSIIGTFLMFLFLLKAVVAYGLWTEKDWAVNLGIIDTILGISVCIFVMFIYPFINTISGFILNLRLELLFLIPFLLKLLKIKIGWNSYIK